MLLQTEQTDEPICDSAAETGCSKTPSPLAQNDIIELNVPKETKQFLAPSIGMEFDSYDDAYNYYVSYASEYGFSVRVKNSWFKRNSREKYGAVLCCSSQGFKRVRDVDRVRKDTRTGCPAMLRMRLVDSTKRWRVLEVNLEHNHSLEPKNFHYKSTKKKMDNRNDKKLNSDNPEAPDVQPVKVYRTLVIDTDGKAASDYSGGEGEGSLLDQEIHLNLKKGDSQALYNYLCRMQLTNPNFFYSMDLNDEGRLRNVFWVDARSRAANYYFCDVIFFDTTCLSNKFEIPLVSFVGTNHHGRSVLLGCGLLCGETTESYVWIFKAWLTTTFGCSPKIVITDRCCNILQNAVSQVFPNSRHVFDPSRIIKKIPEKLGGLCSYESIKKAFLRAAYDTLKPYDFEAAWGYMIQQFGLCENEWLRSLYNDRAKWANAYLKDAFFMGMIASRPGDSLNSFFEKYVQKQTSIKEFVDKYELALYRKHNTEAIDDAESRTLDAELKTKCPYETQMSEIYTRQIFKRFQVEVEGIQSCSDATRLHANGLTEVFSVKEQVAVEGANHRKEIRDFEVLFDRDVHNNNEVRCVCRCFEFYGYLCRHALCVLCFNGIEEIPSKYVLSRWKKDYRRAYGVANCNDDVSGTGRIERANRLFMGALRVVEEGSGSVSHYRVALRAFEESLDRFHDVKETKNH